MWIALPCASAFAGNFYPGVSPSNVFWPGGAIPYEIDTNLTVPEQQTYLDGIREWELAAHVHFVAHTTETNWILFKYLSNANIDSVDLFSVPEVVTVSSLSRAQVCHEMGHALGFTHENIRTDKNNYLTVLTNNIHPASNIVWFIIDPNSVTNGPYDFESVMHLANNFSSVDPDNLFTQLAKPPYAKFQPRMGNLALSKGDRAAAAYLYGAGPVLTNVVTTTADGGVGSLRAALYYATDHPGSTIRFDIPPGDPGFSNGVFTINLSGYLPPLVTDGTIIDGSTQPGFVDHPLIVVDGSRMISEAYDPGTVTGLLIYAADCRVKNLSFQNFNWNGITLRYPDATNNTISGCWCGLDWTGSNAAPNAYEGILIYGGASRNTIGGTNALDRNVLSGNHEYGLFVVDTNTAGNIVLGNFIGSDSTGMIPAANGSGGLILSGGTHDNIVGGPTAGARNVISGNVNGGLWVTGSGVSNNLVTGNYMGLNRYGTGALPNTFAGVYVLGGAQSNYVIGNVISGNDSEGLRIAEAGTSSNVVQGNLVGCGPAGTNAIPNGFAGVNLLDGAIGNTIGGTTAAARNVLSGNGTVGFNIDGASNNVIEGDFIGTDITGGAALPNGFAGGYVIDGARDNLLGGAAPGAGNVISGNATYGIYVRDPGTTGNFIQGNIIGARADGTNALGNGFVGIILFGGSTRNVIGLNIDGSGAGNTIAYNVSTGVRLDDAVTSGNTIRGNSIYGNGGLGVDLAGPAFYGVTTNDVGDADTGPNNLQNFPVFTSAYLSAGVTILSGTLNSSPGGNYLLDFYRNDVADPSGYGQGQIYLGSVLVTTDGSGNGVFGFGIPGSGAGKYFTATATDLASGDSSEFNEALAPVPGGGPPVVSGPFARSSSGFSLRMSSLDAGRAYRLQVSTNLVSWVDLTNFIPGGTNLIVTDSTATNFPRRFYRGISP